VGRRYNPRSFVLTTIAGAAVLLGTTGDAHAYSVKKTAKGDLVHWEERSVAYTIDPSVDRAVASASAAAEEAMRSWSGVVGAPDLDVVERTAGSPTEPGFDRKNGVFFMRGGYAPAGRALAVTVLTYDNTSGKILDADVVVNGSYSFEVLRSHPAGLPDTEAVAGAAHLSNTDGVTHGTTSVTRSRETVYDLHHVVAHELGHSLGMNDELAKRDALMYRYSAPNDASIRAPESDDIAGLAELYSQRLEASGNGCGSATVAPKKPSAAGSRAAMFAAFGLLLFLAARARRDRRARAGFVVAAAVATVALVPSLSGRRGPGVAQATEAEALGHARAKVLGTSTSIESGLFKTSYRLSTTTCRATACPKSGYGVSWGGTIGHVTQEIGGEYAPTDGEEVDVSFTELPSALGALTSPLAGRSAETTPARVSVVTSAP
jgi:hypothetical protein